MVKTSFQPTGLDPMDQPSSYSSKCKTPSEKQLEKRKNNFYHLQLQQFILSLK